jgi:hypothetical protein
MPDVMGRRVQRDARLKRGHIRLKARKRARGTCYGMDFESTLTHLLQSEPFCRKRHLVHRVRFRVRHHDAKDAATHETMDMWCGAQGRPEDDNMLTDLDGSMLLCATCERIATDKGEPSADSLVGHHVHVGRMVARQTCCLTKRESN